MQRHSAQKQTRNLLNIHLVAPSTRYSLLKKPSPMTTSGILFVGLAATAGISSLAFALQHDTPPSTQAPDSALTHGISSDTSAQSTNETSIDATILNSTQSTADGVSSAASSDTVVSGTATINDEVIPITDGTTQRSYTDSDGSQNTVIITVDGASTVINDDDSRTRIQVYSSSSSSSSDNTTRGSPRR